MPKKINFSTFLLPKILIESDNLKIISKKAILIYTIYAIIICSLTLFFYLFFSFNPFLYSYKDSEFLEKTDLMENYPDPFLPNYSKTVISRNGEILSIFLNKIEQWHINSNDEIPYKLKVSVVEYEDRHFYSHMGIDIFAILRTIKNNFSSTKRQGASTITMQVIKILEKNPRTYGNKLKEMIHALRLESMYSKDDILKMYLNNAPYGGNIVGYESASILYFSKSPQNLTWAQSALLAVLPNAPGLINISKNRNLLLKKRNILLEKLHKLGYFDSTILKLALGEELPSSIEYHKNIAPHLSLRIINENKTPQSILKSTINKEIQLRFEERAKEYNYKMKQLGIYNLGALLLDSKNSEVLAYIGSQDFLDIDGYGQIDAITAKRSPGSVLKPLLYALSIDSGLIAPESKLIDVPLFFSNFNPKNAQNKYYGLVSARDSLTMSLNIPFVRLLQEYGLNPFFWVLKDILGFKDTNSSKYGLSLVLGTKELNMFDIAKIYLGLANMGEFGNIYYKLPHKIESKRRILSAESSYLTLDALKNLARFGLENNHKETKIFSWKSGTSYGRRDAWAAGTSPKYTLIVWVGNFTGEGNPNLFGVESAGNFLFELLSELDGVNKDWEKPSNFVKVTLDKETGYRMSDEFKDFGIETIEIELPKSAKTLRYSPFLQKVWLGKDGKTELDSKSPDFINASPSIKLDLPADVLNFYAMQNVDIRPFIKTQNNKNLRIIYPTKFLKILQPKDLNKQQELIVRIANLRKMNVHWYLDKKYLGSFKDNTKMIHLDIGEHEITLIGEDGSRDNVKFLIEK